MSLTPAPSFPINIRTPLSFAPAGAFVTNNTTIDAVADNIRNLLNTNWGERPMQYYFGANLRAVLFCNSADVEQQVTDHITSAVEKWLPGVAVIDITVTTQGADLDYNACSVKVTFGLANTELTGQVSVTVK